MQAFSVTRISLVSSDAYESLRATADSLSDLETEKITRKSQLWISLPLPTRAEHLWTLLYFITGSKGGYPGGQSEWCSK
jgi:hypothetical protein